MKAEELLKRAFYYASVQHAEQTYGDKPFIAHPKLVASLLAQCCPKDYHLIAAGYLHDILENTRVQREHLEAEFGKDIADLVFEVTKTKYNTFPNLKSTRGYILKFADRLANLSQMGNWDEEKQTTYRQKSIFWQTV